MAVDYETRIDAQWNHNRNTLSQYNLKIQEAVQVPDIYRDDFIKTIQASMTGRYGQQGSKATMQWFQEHAIELPHQLYLQLQQMIEAGRNEFQNEQKKLLDLTRSYKRVTGTVWTGFMMNIAGFPSKEFTWSKYEILVDEQTQQQFSEKKAKAIKL
ncbi:hypothetical protein CW745_01285 [Psychromonas sp. psych-6C06]|nr:hypothetical protein CW745_01285 [Psychromonas sp. psych-6C06]